MKNRFFTLLPGLWLLSTCLLSAQPGIVIDTAFTQTGSTVCVAMKSKKFNAVFGMEGTISWDPQVLEYDTVQNISLVSMTYANFKVPSQAGQLLFSWTDPSAYGVTVVDDLVLFEVCFNVVGPVGSSTAISLDTATIVADFVPGNLWTYVPEPPIIFCVTFNTTSSNTKDFEQAVLMLYPNPVLTGTSVIIINTQQEKTATLLVSNTLGQIVFEEKVGMHYNENTFQIPGTALIKPGTYLVSLITEQGVFSGNLVVH
ncbi:MAG: T9SS type A sorting domain-containing protein [Saprospiraceae bacterium]|nr:T9SS type A sorting domain-containing protein [Saprospiraceae bacterium]MCB9353654.1 T9SS type A sorting domain-containing protein [Lewinellaceae bacterium]